MTHFEKLSFCSGGKKKQIKKIISESPGLYKLELCNVYA